jgi:hypothetical protein
VKKEDIMEKAKGREAVLDLARVRGFPSTRLESEDASLARTVVGNFQVSVVTVTDEKRARGDRAVRLLRKRENMVEEQVELTR